MKILLSALLLCASLIGAGSASPDGYELSSREPIEWCDVWIPHSTENQLPRVLLVGDSITRGYYGEVEKRPAGKAYVARLTTSAFASDPVLIDQLEMVLKHNQFEVIHFNNGMHGWQHSEEAYAKAMPDVVAAIRRLAPNAKLIGATTTPVNRSGKEKQLDTEKTDRVKARNASLKAFCEKQKIPVDDLFAATIDKPELHNNDGVHFEGKGYAVVGAQVAAEVEKLLK